MQYVVCSMQYAVCSMQYAVCSLTPLPPHLDSSFRWNDIYCRSTVSLYHHANEYYPTGRRQLSALEYLYTLDLDRVVGYRVAP